ncbi:MAG: glycosyltransferase family 2 protein [Acidimicrobiales bacterium]|jgi:glycosyltransferase involved in cell wall biosynthesis|nr:glycosyltransferase family 2 protein [Acidimicrobiales bacterium]
MIELPEEPDYPPPPPVERPRGAGRTLVVIPAKDEEEPLPGVLAELRAALPDVDVVVVDDGSTDRTGEVARAGGAVVLRLPFNLGIGGALRAGFRYAVEQGYDRAVQFDADGQHDAAEISTLLAALGAGADMAIGNRFGDASHTYDVGRVRARAMGLLRFAVRQFSGQRFHDTSSGFRAFNRPVLEFFARTYPSEYMESVEALLLACAEGFRVAEVPVVMHQRTAGAPSNRNLRLLYHYLRLLLVMTVSATRRNRPEGAVV